MGNEQHLSDLVPISPLLVDIMVMGLPNHYDRDSLEWWVECQKEIKFALEILTGLGLVERVLDSHGQVGWHPLPKMERLYLREEYYRDRREREARLQLSIDDLNLGKSEG
jgi:hypothetical protein